MVLLAKQHGKLQEYKEENLPQLVYPIIEEAMTVEKKQKISFSKLMCIAIILLTFIVVGFAIVLMIITNDVTPLEYLIPSVFAEASVVTGFYSYKAKAENKIKLETRRLILEKALGTEFEEEEEYDEEDEGLDS